MGRLGKFMGPVLYYLLMSGTLLIALSSPTGVRRLSRVIGVELKRADARRKFFWTVAYLRRKKLIDYREAPDGTISLTLTEQGRRRALRYKLDAMKLEKPARWDGKWRIIAFDIPETKRGGRDALRLKLKELGLIQLQKSIWAWPYECKNEVDFIAQLFAIGPHVHYFVAESVTSDKFLKYKFDLA